MKRTSILLSASVMALVIAGPAWAQQDTGAVANDGGQLPDIVVTAQKRSQNLQNVPVAVTAVTGDELAAKAVNQFADLSRVASSLTITQGTDAASSTAIIRGIGTAVVSVGVEPSVAIIVDDIALLQQGQAFSGLNDIERIEVLRGPQGTLFGKSSSAGVVNIVTAAPAAQFGGGVLGTVTTDGERRVQGAVTGPLADSVGFRLSSFYGNRDGYVKNLAGGRALGAERTYGVQGKLVIDPTDRIELALSGNYAYSNGNSTPRTFRAIGVGNTIYGLPLTAADLAGINPGPGNFRSRQNLDPRITSKSYLLSGHLKYSFGPVDLISITGYQHWRYSLFTEQDYTTLPVGGSPTGAFLSAPYLARQTTQELRLVSATPGPLQYLVGFYFADGSTSRGGTRLPVAPANWNATAGTRTWAVFGQATYDIASSTHVDLGLRYNDEKIDVSFQNVLPSTGLSGAALANGCFQLCRGSANDDAVTGRISLRQDLSERILAYATAVTGHKGKAFDISTGFTPSRAANPVNPEKSTGFEAGLKSRFLDNRVQLNIAAFLTDYRDFQAQGSILQPDGSYNLRIANVGKLRTKGIEVEMKARPTSSLQFDLSATYLDAVVRSYPNANCYPGQTVALGCTNIGTAAVPVNVQNLAGKRLANAPRFKVGLGGTYTIEMPQQPFDGFITLNYNWQSKVNYELIQTPLSAQSAYGVAGASFGLKPRTSYGMSVTAFVNNIFSRHYATGLLSPAFGGQLGTISQILPRDARRYGGVRVGYNF